MESQKRGKIDSMEKICGSLQLYQEGRRTFIIGTVPRGDFRGIRMYAEISGRHSDSIKKIIHNIMRYEKPIFDIAKSQQEKKEELIRAETLLRLSKELKLVRGKRFSRLIGSECSGLAIEGVRIYAIHINPRMKEILIELAEQPDLRKKIVKLYPTLPLPDKKKSAKGR